MENYFVRCYFLFTYENSILVSICHLTNFYSFIDECAIINVMMGHLKFGIEKIDLFTNQNFK